MIKRLLLTGSTSRAASRIIETFPNTREQPFFILPSSQNMDITDSKKVFSYIREQEPDAIVHFAAITDLKKCEQERNQKEGLIWRTNVIGTQNIVNACRRTNLPLIFISTSLVFSGNKEHPGPYTEDTPPENNVDKLCWYGTTKAVAESIVLKYAKSALIRLSSTVRSSYLPHKHDFLWKIRETFKTAQPYAFFMDQHTTLSDLTLLAPLIHIILEQKHTGIFHLSTPDTTTPHEVATYLASLVNFQGEIRSTTLEKYREQSGEKTISLFYPPFSGLRCDRTQELLHVSFPSWKESIQAFVKENNL